MLLAEVIKKRRKELGYTQSAFAHALGVARPTITRWELGWTNPNFYDLVRITKYLDIDLRTIDLHTDIGDNPFLTKGVTPNSGG